MLKMLSIRLRYWHLMAFFIWLSFKFQFSAVPTGHVILALKDLGKGKIHPRQAIKACRQSRCRALLSLTSALDGDGWSTPHPGCFTTGTDPIPFV
jgi:hypothetical protein